jgi:hypothetical protein
MAPLALLARQGFQIYGIDQLIQIDNWPVSARNPIQNKVGANKADTSGQQNGHQIKGNKLWTYHRPALIAY